MIAVTRTPRFGPLACTLALALSGCANHGTAPLPRPDAGATDGATSCTAPTVYCGGSCLDTQTDATNCGGCGVTCPAGRGCSAGACAVVCGGSTPDLCGDVCVNMNSDATNCGTCGHACAGGEVCSDGACGGSCSGATPTLCGTTCVDTDTDQSNCGACGDACGDVEVCSGGTCSLSCGGSTPTLCGTACVDTDTNRDHCGGCATACAAGEICMAGSCTITCGGGTPTRCGTSCVDTDSDPSNCGACGVACGSGERCAMGACALSCPGSLVECAMACVDTAVDPSNCGACGTVCTLPHVSVPFCSSGACAVGGCAAGFADCDGAAADGCEVATDSDASNCGGCGVVCGAGASCMSGSCGATSKRVFVTSVAYNGNLGGTAGADALCQMHAGRAGLGGTWRAWISVPGDSPSTRFTHATVPYVLVNGVRVANDWTDLTDSSLATAISVTETGGAPPASNTNCAGTTLGREVAWSATMPSGAAMTSSACSGFTSSTGSGLWGHRTQTDQTWSSWCSGGLCSWVAPLYCFEQ